ncbi:histone-lysine N-methyltransferase, H3 lysine-9 specific SUVH4 [Iris pallida]|uniref:Histone-lysine N-methyltransferase, H3 lysine-9 specific SUVH4 n=1 Tax=Iris pallida TaxID=29817 RepID=A0AAX6GUM0_IRIPA|nr:histone-lysine N-methyltransferase, H3 lysine-9 specific SUVH4 [Iris pallida]
MEDKSAVAVEAFPGRRCSARYLGKERPNYCQKTAYPVAQPTSPKKSTDRKRPRPGNSTPKVLQVLPPTPDQLVVDNEVAGLCSREMPNVVSGVPNIVNGVSERDLPNVNVDAFSVNPHSGAKTAHLRVKETLRLFNTHYLQLIQEEEKRAKQVEAKNSPKKKNDDKAKASPKSKKGSATEADTKRASKRPDLKAITKMMQNGAILYPDKMIGALPGIEVGDHFFSRAEMVVLGLHSHWLNGIDYMGLKYAGMELYKAKGYTFPLAVCIVLSGMYEDDLDNSEDVIYTGQGGHDLLSSKRQIKDQKLERGNLALKNNYVSDVPVRVIRGHESKSSYCGKVYTYDGLYKVVKYWADKGVSGYTVFKYKLRRVEGQPVLTTDQVRFSRAEVPRSISDVRGLVCDDISGGQEKIPIPATNVVDDPPFAPTDFTYFKSIKLAKNVKLPKSTHGCNCKGECVDPRICSCARLNGTDFPYVRKDGGRLIEAKAVIFECGPGCGCSLSCVNRTSQQGLKYQLEVFRTANKGWAVRSWDTIPAGAPVCEYIGELSRSDEVDAISENNYIFDIDCLQTMKGLDGRETRTGGEAVLATFDDKRSEVEEYCINARVVGNVARFINHSCQPNLFVQCVLSSHHDVKLARVVLFAADTIPPLQELSYDYGYALDSVVRPDGSVVKLACYCGAVGCRKRLH